MKKTNPKLIEKINTCKIKASYSSESLSRAVIEFNKQTNAQDVYVCPICKKYHIKTVNRKLSSRRSRLRSKSDKETRRIISKFRNKDSK